MNRYFIVLIVFLLSACAAMPKTSDELMATTDVKQTYCYDMDEREVAKRAQYFLLRCYGESDVFQVVDEGENDFDRYSVKSRSGFGISVDIRPSSGECVTHVEMYALRSHLRDKFQRIDKAIKGGDIQCGLI